MSHGLRYTQRHGLNILFFVILFAFSPARAGDDYRIRPSGDDIELTTPYGTKTVTGSFPLTRGGNYRIEVPLSDLHPKQVPSAVPIPTPTPIPTPAVSAAPSLQPSPPVAENKTAPLESDTDRHVLEANHLYNQGRFYEATLVVDVLLKANPDFVRGWVMKGSLMYVQGQKDLARKAWEKALALSKGKEEIESVKEILGKYK